MDHRIKIKESEKRDKYLDLVREVKKLWNMKVTVMPVVISALGIVPKGLIRGLEDLEIRGRPSAIQTTALLRSARILRRAPENCGDLPNERPSANAGMKNSQGVIQQQQQQQQYNNNNNNNNNSKKMEKTRTIKRAFLKTN